ncbi:MAG TPA: hybrid sensor histidine kinase/response regulator [Noviherbaspirillum sp.]|jgi:two-component system sensor histidine kinase and response regulator WspE|uniref:hybrid sensor histidine kinase/response regulator n=1 Tax=Noviherbaspirillum sp. TaxID=1926288 RepID=UPI002F923398
MSGDDKDYSSMSLHALFRGEAEGQAHILTDGLLALDRNPDDLAAIEPLMRAAHSLKGAARIVNLEPVERLAHVMEDCFVAAQKGRLRLTRTRIDRLLAGVDMIVRIASVDEAETAGWIAQNKPALANLLASLYQAADPAADLGGSGDQADAPAPAPAPSPSPPPGERIAAGAPGPADDTAPAGEAVLKVSSRSFDRLLSLASEARVGAHALQPYLQSLQRYKQRQQDMFAAFEQLRQTLLAGASGDIVLDRLALLQQRVAPLREELAARIAEFEAHERRLLSVARHTLDEVLALRMRPFADGVRALPRMVRDLARSLGKDARLEIGGRDTLVDRDVLARVENILNQLLRNAVDHGIEQPQQRAGAGKPVQAAIRLEARHSGGMLVIQVSDDGAGVDLERVRGRIVERQMASTAMAAAMSDAELLDFLLLPAFSLKESAGTVSGRGVGLDVVQAEVRAMNGALALSSRTGSGFTAEITLPLSQSIVRTLVAEVAGEPYAVPIARIERVLRLAAADIQTLEDKQFFAMGDEHVSLIPAAQLLELGEARSAADGIPVVVIGTPQRRYGLAVDAILGEQSLAVQPIEQVFGKLRDVSAAALLDDGTPVLILDVADMIAGIERLAAEGGFGRLQRGNSAAERRRKRVLVIDDSLTVREMERKLLQARGYEVDTAVDGMDGWNAVRSNDYALVITDVDMPRMDGIELTALIKADGRLHALPVMIVSYKDRPDDRARGIDAGADYYLTKGSFHDETLLEAVFDLIGEAAP